MGCHLHLHASKYLSLEEAQLWCGYYGGLNNSYPTGSELARFNFVQELMDTMDRSESTNRMEHGPSWSGIACWPFLHCKAYVVDDGLIKRAIDAARKYKADQQSNPHAKDSDKTHDWESDQVIQFLKDHVGWVVWGYGD